MFDLTTHDMERIKCEAEKEVNGLPADYSRNLWDWLQIIFALWKQDLGDRNPKYGPATKTGNALLDAMRFNTPIPFEDVEPYQCAGPGVTNYIDLALKLWIDRYPPFLKCAESASISHIVAVVLLHEIGRGAELRSILAAKDVLHTLRETTLAVKLDAITPLAKTAFAYKKTQAQKAKMPRSRIKVDGEEFSLTLLIGTLASRKDQLGDPLPTKDLWNELISELDKRGLSPQEQTKHKKPVVLTFEKNDGGERDEIKYSSFSSMLSKARSKTC